MSDFTPIPPCVKLHPTIKIIRELLVKEMGLAEDQVWLYGEKWKIPPGKGLAIVVEYKYGKPYSSRLAFNSTEGDLASQNRVNRQEFIGVNLFSYNFDAQNRCPDVYFAMNSVYAQQLQEKFSFHIGRISQEINLSAVEGDKYLRRFEIPMVVLSHYSQEKSVDFFDSFDGEILIDEGKTDAVEIDFTQPLTDPLNGGNT